MPPIVVVLITVAVTLPIAWLISEFKGYRFARIALGILAILGGYEYSTWLGHWEDDGGYWIVISDVERPYDIYRSGYPGDMMTGVTVSDDFSSIEFFVGCMWKHTVTLVNKYEAEHVWFDLEKKSEWKKERLYKLVRTTPDQKLFTQQPEPNLKKNV